MFKIKHKIFSNRIYTVFQSEYANGVRFLIYDGGWVWVDGDDYKPTSNYDFDE